MEVFMKYFILFILLNFIIFNGFSQNLEEKNINLFSLKSSPYTFKAKTEMFSGYDSNVKLDSERKGDTFEELFLSFNINTPRHKSLYFIFNYNLDLLNYNEFTDASSILNNLNFSFNKKLFDFVLSCGYDFSNIYYPNNEDYDFLFHKIFFSLRHNIKKDLYQQFVFSRGYKYYINKKNFDNLYNNLDEKRNDNRYTFDYILAKNIKNLSLRLKNRYSINDSNVVYSDFYDYKSITPGFEINYKLEKILVSLKFDYTIKNYKRTISSSDSKEKDKLFNFVYSIDYLINNKNSIIFEYNYNRNSSNERLNRYFENIFKLGLRHNF